VGELADGIGRDARLTLGEVEGVALDLRLVGLEPVGRPVDELAVLEARGDDLPPDGVRERDVGPDVESEPDVRPFGRARPTRVDSVQPGAVSDAAKEVVEEDRVRLTGVAAPQDDQVRLFGLTV
jgi:hypothetical protein